MVEFASLQKGCLGVEGTRNVSGLITVSYGA